MITVTALIATGFNTLYTFESLSPKSFALMDIELNSAKATTFLNTAQWSSMAVAQNI